MDCTIRVAKTKALISFADLRLCFRICKKPVFSRCGSYDNKEVMGTWSIEASTSPSTICQGASWERGSLVVERQSLEQEVGGSIPTQVAFVVSLSKIHLPPIKYW